MNRLRNDSSYAATAHWALNFLTLTRYVLVSRVTDRRWICMLLVGEAPDILALVCRIPINQQDPRNFHLLGLPPVDMLEEVAQAWRAAGLDVGPGFGISCCLPVALGLVAWELEFSIEHRPCRGVSTEGRDCLARLRVQGVFCRCRSLRPPRHRSCRTGCPRRRLPRRRHRLPHNCL